jgi:hypothetical protein
MSAISKLRHHEITRAYRQVGRMLFIAALILGCLVLTGAQKSTSINPYQGFTWRGLTGVDTFGAGDRPIGMLANRFWFPRALVLNFDTAQSAATTSPSNTGTGVVELRYIGDTEDYSLYLKIERLR